MSETPLVHVELEARALCGFSYDRPSRWPAGHTSVTCERADEATCGDCRGLWARYRDGDESMLPDDDERLRELQFVSSDLAALYGEYCELGLTMRILHVGGALTSAGTARLREIAARLVDMADKLEAPP